MGEFKLVLFDNEEVETKEEMVERFLAEEKTDDKRLDVFRVLTNLDKKNYNFYNELTEAEQKKLSGLMFILTRWASLVESPMPELHEWWIKATNERFNKHLLELKTIDTAPHTQLQWLMACAASPGMGRMRHAWIAYKKKEGSRNAATKKKERLHELLSSEEFPSLSDEEIDLLIEINSKDDIKEYLGGLGFNAADIKKLV